MPNAEYDTPAELGTLGRELSRVLEGLRANWEEGGSFAGALSVRAAGLDDERVRALADAVGQGLRETNNASAELVALIERIGRGGHAITVRDLRAAPPARAGRTRRIGVAALRATAAAGAGLFGLSELPGSVVPHWLGIAGALLGFAAGGAMPGLGALDKDNKT